ncbi:LssY C-terminal domain-containing protein [Planctomicrobium sp. SH661]|uniref:LssY C-terminal domain-containing protein n=1 Tax=Planctomicrobium sp. SH661 TaxID=3448124 RepID=UPI003F5BA795
MSTNSTAQPHPLHERTRRQRVRVMLALMLWAYVSIAYLIMPEAWHRYVRKHPALDDVPGITLTHSGIPGDPVNLALVGTREQLVKIMLLAKWSPADPVTLRSSLRIAADTVFRREYVDAPVSSLYLFGRKEDLAFEKPVGKDPKQRNHVRFWKSDKLDPDGRPYWFGAATFDHGVGFSHTTGQITHHISGNVDAERDELFADLNATGDLSETYTVTGFHKVLQGRNGGGDKWWTDGNLRVGIINPDLQAPSLSDEEAKPTP